MNSLPQLCGVEANGNFKSGDAARYKRLWVGRAARGGDSSNTPHQTSQAVVACIVDAGVTGQPASTYDDRVTGGEDAAVINLRMTWAADDEAMASFLTGLDAAKLEAQKLKSRVAPYRCGDLLFEMSPRGANIGGGRGVFLDYILRTSGLSIYIGCDRTPKGRKGFNGRVSMSSALLMAHDGLDLCWEFAKYLLTQLGAVLQSNQLSRVDACVDMAFDMDTVKASYESRSYVTRAHKHMGIYEGTERLQTVYFGLTGVRCRIYDKIAETLGNDEKRLILQARRLFYGPKLTRVEFQLRREELGAFLVETVEDWQLQRGGICEYLCTKWLRFTGRIKSRTHTGRAKACRWWEDVRIAFALAFQNSLDDPKCCMPVHYLTADPIALVKQAFGCLAAAHVIVGQGAYEELGRFVAWAGAKLAEVAGQEYEGVMDGKSLRYMVGDVDIAHKMEPCPF